VTGKKPKLLLSQTASFLLTTPISRPIILPPSLRDGEYGDGQNSDYVCAGSIELLPVFDCLSGINSVKENVPNATVEDKTT